MIPTTIEVCDFFNEVYRSGEKKNIHPLVVVYACNNGDQADVFWLAANDLTDEKALELLEKIVNTTKVNS